MSAVHFLEIVTTDVDATCSLYESVHNLSFGPPDKDVGNARVAKRPDGSFVSVRAPLAAHEGPITRAYQTVDDIRAATDKAEKLGAAVAYPPTKQGSYGTFAIVIQDEVQHGLWQP